MRPVVWIRYKIITLWMSVHSSYFPSVEKELSAKILFTFKNVSSTRNLPPCRFPSLDLAAKSNLCQQECSPSWEGADTDKPLLRAEVGRPGGSWLHNGLQGSPICTHRIKEPSGAPVSSDLRDLDSSERKHTFNQLINLLLRGSPTILTRNFYFLTCCNFYS